MAQKLFRRNGDNSMREAIEELIEEKVGDETPIETEERNLLANILSLRDRTISDVMVPRADIVAIDIGAPIDDLVSLINRGGHSRIPVFQKTLDDAVGMVHIKDVLAARNSALQKDQLLSLKNIIREVLFVAPSMQVLELLLEMRVKRIHMALVVDEYGGVDGLLTIEDLVEEIVGEIEDEHDQEEVPVLKLQSDGSLIADARVLIESFENLAGNILGEEEREEIETLGGLVVSL
ncbi:MAG: CBS domain-containing protein, partial [Rhodospirillales bacterium]|nr:CBS domain-containing protein [Rhodospirillales bacterium]